jgi:hypothetical protein
MASAKVMNMPIWAFSRFTTYLQIAHHCDVDVLAAFSGNDGFLGDVCIGFT